MSTSEAKQLANRANAQRSTGPTTPEGRQQSSVNALRHGVLASDAVIRAGEGSEEAEAFARVVEELHADLHPAGALEELLVGKLAVVLWRWRRVLRYELGAIREQADDAVANWHAQQRAAYRKAVADRAIFSSLHRGEPPPEMWKATEDLESELRDAEDRLAAVLQPDPLATPSEPLVWALAEAAEEWKMPVKRALGLKGSGDWFDFPLAEVEPEAVARLFAAYCQRLSVDAAEGWQRLCMRLDHLRDQAQSRVERRRREEERLRLLTALPSQEAIDKVIRYEAHLAREFARTLEQVQKARILRGAGEPEEPQVSSEG